MNRKFAGRNIVLVTKGRPEATKKAPRKAGRFRLYEKGNGVYLLSRGT